MKDGTLACPSKSRLAVEPKWMLQATSATVPEPTRAYVVSAFAFSVGISLLVVREMVNQVPKHVAIIMDGNGRWARQRGWPRSRGHLEGAKAVKACVEACLELGILYVTLLLGCLFLSALLVPAAPPENHPPAQEWS